MRYFITFVCYGSRLHGDERSSVDRNHNAVGSPMAEISPDRVEIERQQMVQLPYGLDETRRSTVLLALREGCLHRGWILWAAHVRTNHVHVIVEANIRPELVMNALKAYASRGLNDLGIDEPNRKRWARHGSTRWLWKDENVQEAIRYVIHGQGESMEVYLAELL
jgi:REP element-mobilizing transposase RayT